MFVEKYFRLCPYSFNIFRESSGYKYSRTRLNGLALQLSTTKGIIEQIIMNFGLFSFDEEYFWSESLFRRMEERDNKVRKAKESAQRRWDDYYAKQGQKQPDPEALPFSEQRMEYAGESLSDGKSFANESLSESYANAEETHSESSAIKGKEKKGKEIKENEIFSLPPKPDVSEE